MREAKIIIRKLTEEESKTWMQEDIAKGLKQPPYVYKGYFVKLDGEKKGYYIGKYTQICKVIKTLFQDDLGID